jgi:hypothetical protein
MGEFEGEIIVEPAAVEPADGEPVQPQPEVGAESLEAAVATAPESAGDSVGAEEIPAIQDQLALEVDDIAVPPATGDAESAASDEPALGDPEPEPEPAVPSDDDLAVAIAVSSEQVETEATLADIAPNTVHEGPAEEIVSEQLVRSGAPWWPFLVYLGLWFVLAGVAVWQFQELPHDTVIYETQQYTVFVFGGLVLAATGVLLILAVWLGARMSPTRQRVGLFSSAFLKGAAFLLIGIVVWWGTLMALDYLRLGRLI